MGVQVCFRGCISTCSRQQGPLFVSLQLTRVLCKHLLLITVEVTERLHARLWTDDMNLKLVETSYPWFLNVFTSLDHIMRADSARYMYMHHYGGADPFAALSQRLISHVLSHTFTLPGKLP